MSEAERPAPCASAARPRALVIVNPISGRGRRLEVARARADLALMLMHAHGVDGEVRITDAPGHAAELARHARAEGAAVVVAWGGDGTINEVASALAFGPTSLGVVPSGSGNGFARELGIPFEPAPALTVALTGRDHAVDAGELDGRLFFNVAGLGFDARIAYRFATDGLRRRGPRRYLEAAARELLSFTPHEYDVTVDGATRHLQVFLVALANTRQYGNGTIIAPHARPDDGRLDLVTVGYCAVWRALPYVPRLFAGTLDRAPGVTMRQVATLELRAAGPMLYHVDGEPHLGGTRLAARVHPGVLRVRLPA